MVNLQKIDDSSVKFVFTDSDHYLVGNGEIVVPINSLSLVIDDSEMVTFKKSATGDPFISFRADNSNLGTKEAIEQFYKENMVGAGGLSEEEVQDMIDSATSGMATDTQVQTLEANKFDDATYDSVNHLIKFTANGVQKATIDASAFIKDGMVSTVAIDGDYLVITFNTDAGKDPIRIPLSSIFDPSVLDDYYTKTQIDGFLNNATTMLTTISGEVDTNTSDIAAIWDTIDEKEEVIASALTEVRQDVADIDAKEEVIASALTEVRQNKQDALQYYSEIDDTEDNAKESIIEVNQGTDEDYVNAMVDTYTQYSEHSKSSYIDISAGVQNDDGGQYSNITVNHNSVGIHSDYVPNGGEMSDAHIDMTNDGGITIESLNGDNVTVMFINPSGVTINDERVATEPYVDAATSGKADTSALTAHADNANVHFSGTQKSNYDGLEGQFYVDDSWDIMPLTIFNDFTNDYSMAMGQFDQRIAANASAVTAVSGAVIDNEYTVSQSLNDLNSRKQDALVSGTNIKTINNESILGSGNIEIQGGGATYSAGTNISIDTANTINCTLNLRNGTGFNSIVGVQGEAKGRYNFAFGESSTAGTQKSNHYAFAIGYNCTARKDRSIAYGANNDVKEIDSAAFGENITLNAPRSFAAGYHNTTNNWTNIALGEELTTNNRPEFATGAYNNSVSDSTASGQTLFSVGNGTSSARHNAFEIRQNGDIYVNDGTNDVRLQDTILALGGLKLVKISQADYDVLATRDENTLYIIPDADGGGSDWEQ